MPQQAPAEARVPSAWLALAELEPLVELWALAELQALAELRGLAAPQALAEQPASAEPQARAEVEALAEMGAMGGSRSDGGPAGDSGTAVGGLDPVIPAISGACPQFTAGTNTVTVMGQPATVIAGAQQTGTGSLLFYWYGTGKLGDVTLLPQSIKDDITAQGGIVYAPQSALNTGGDCSGTGTWGLDDFNISDQIVACAVMNYGINPKRIYATGCSAGGLQTGCMAIARSSYIASVAPNSGGVIIGYPKLQDPMRVPNVITMNGGTGDNVIVNFGQTSEGFDNYILHYGGFAVNCVHNSGHCGAPASVYASAW